MQSSSKLLPPTLNDLPGISLRPRVCPSRLSPVNQVAAQRPALAPNDQRRPPSSRCDPITNTCSTPSWHPRETPLPRCSATGDHSEALGNARHVVQHYAQQEDEDAGHQDHSAHPGPGGAFGHAPPVGLLLHRLLGRPALQRLLFRGDGHHGDRLLLAPRQQAAAHVSGQQRSLLGDGQGQHVAPIAGKFDEHWGVLGRVRDGDDRQDLGVVGELRHGEARGQLGDAPAPGAPHVLLARPHLLEAHRAAGVFAVQQLGPSPGAVVIETDLTFQQGILGQRLHRASGKQGGQGQGERACSQGHALPRLPSWLSKVVRGSGSSQAQSILQCVHF